MDTVGKVEHARNAAACSPTGFEIHLTVERTTMTTSLKRVPDGRLRQPNEDIESDYTFITGTSTRGTHLSLSLLYLSAVHTAKYLVAK